MKWTWFFQFFPNFLPSLYARCRLIYGDDGKLSLSKREKKLKDFLSDATKVWRFPHRGSVRSFIFHPPQRGNHDIEREDVQRRGKCFKKKNWTHTKKKIFERKEKKVENFQLKTCVKVSLSHFYVIFLCSVILFLIFFLLPSAMNLSDGGDEKAKPNRRN